MVREHRGPSPVFAGKWIAGASLPDRNPFSFDVRAYLGFLLFGLTPAVLLLLVLHTAAFIRVSRAKHRFRLFYVLLVVAPFISLGFYSPQMYTLRYLFLTLATLLFLVSSRRFTPFVPARVMRTALVVLTILPWTFGLHLPLLTDPALTVTNPTRFPTGDGMFPMGAYLGFAWQARFRDRMAIDHNQKIWLAARSVNYEPCNDNTVPFLITPMSNFVEFAIRLQNKRPRPIDFMAESPCGSAYGDARSILRGIRPDRRDGPFFTYGMEFVSHVENGQLIVRVNSDKKQTAETRLLKDLCEEFNRRDSEVFLRLPSQIPVTPGLRYALFSERGCSRERDSLIRVSWTGKPGETSFAVNPSCFAPFAGWSRTVLPPYIGL